MNTNEPEGSEDETAAEPNWEDSVETIVGLLAEAELSPAECEDLVREGIAEAKKRKANPPRISAGMLLLGYREMHRVVGLHTVSDFRVEVETLISQKRFRISMVQALTMRRLYQEGQEAALQRG